MSIAVSASIEPSHAGLEEAVMNTARVADGTTAEFVARCGNERPDGALPEADAARTSTRDVRACGNARRTAARIADRLGLIAFPLGALHGEHAPFLQSGPDPPLST
jgi:hypothetical protein